MKLRGSYKMKRWGTAVVLLFAAIGMFIPGCLDNPSPKGSEFTDDLGDVIILNGNPEKIITLTPALTEIIYFLGAQDRLVGCDSASGYPSDALEVDRVSSWEGGLDTEKLLSKQPDIVFMDKTLDASGSMYDQLVDLNIPVYRIYPRNLEDTLGVMDDIADIIGPDPDSRGQIDDLRSRLDYVRKDVSKMEENEKPRILHVTYYDGNSDPWVSTDSTFSGDIISAAGGIPVVQDKGGLAIQISVERMIVLDPDIIITSQSQQWPTNSRQSILADDAFRDIGAVREERVFDIEGDWMDRTGPRMIDGLEEVHDIVSDYVGS
jgi:iron complex transport system substrate-binding protein